MGAPRWTRGGGALALAALMALAYGAGHMRASPPRAAPEERERGEALAARPVLVERGGGIDRDELRAVVREELARRGEAAAGPREEEDAAGEAEAAARAAKAERSARAASLASAAVAAGIGDGRWDAGDREALREQLPYLDERATHEVLEPLFQAINAQRLTLDGPPI